MRLVRSRWSNFTRVIFTLRFLNVASTFQCNGITGKLVVLIARVSNKNTKSGPSLGIYQARILEYNTFNPLSLHCTALHFSGESSLNEVEPRKEERNDVTMFVFVCLPLTTYYPRPTADYSAMHRIALIRPTKIFLQIARRRSGPYLPSLDGGIGIPWLPSINHNHILSGKTGYSDVKVTLLFFFSHYQTLF